MKKILLVLGILTFPLTANAQTPLKQVPEAIVQEAIKEFADPWCETGYTGLIASVKSCFANVNKYTMEMDKCILGDGLMNHVTNKVRTLSQKTGQPDPTANIAFLSDEEDGKRIQFAFQTPRYAEIGTDIVAYFAPGDKALKAALYKTVNKCPAH